MARRPLHESYTQVTQKSSRWIQVAHDNNNTAKEGKSFNGNMSDDLDFFEKQYKTSLYNRITTLLSALWSYISFDNKEYDMKTTPKRFPGSAAEGLGMSWYSFPVYWLYKYCLSVHLYDVWLLSLLRVPRTQSKQSRLTSLALFLLFLPFIVLAGLVIANCCSFSNCMTQLQNSMKWESAVFSPVEF